MDKGVIIGSGIAGLACAVRLYAQGYEVHVYESNDYPGGKLSEIRQNGFRFDAGPSLFTRPDLVDELFLAADCDPRAYFNYRALPVSCRYFYEDGVRLTGYTDPEKFSNEIEKELSVNSSVIRKYFKNSRLIYERTGHIFLEQPIHKWKTWMQQDVLKALGSIHKMHLLQTVHESNAIRLKEPHLVQLFDRFATYNGSNPYSAPGILTVIPYLEHGLGTFYPEGGMISITKSIVKMLADLGVHIHLNARVEQICLNDQRATGIMVGGKYISSDVVVSNMDITPTYRQLMTGINIPKNILQQQLSSSAIIFYWGISHSFNNLDQHNILFSGDYKREFDEIFINHTISDDPTIYIHLSCRSEPEDAPEGMENWFVMVNAPNIKDQDWDALIIRTRQAVVEKINRMLKTDITAYIVNESVLDPRMIEKKTSSWKGALYGASSNSRMAAFMRHGNDHSAIGNLYFCGGSVHPGGGIPLCLLSARIAANQIKEDHG